MFHQQDEMVSSYLFSFREASYPLFWISEFCLHSYLAPLKCQQNLGKYIIKRNIALTLFFYLMSPTFISLASEANSDNRDMSQVPLEKQ